MMTLKEFRELTGGLSDNTEICFADVNGDDYEFTHLLSYGTNFPTAENPNRVTRLTFEIEKL